MSPLLPTPELINYDDDDVHHDSHTGFKADLLDFLALYKQDGLKSWIVELKQRDFRNLDDAVLIPSFPGSHRGEDISKFGLGKISKALKEHATTTTTALNPAAMQWNLVAQTSSIGSLGETADNWLLSEFLSAFSGGAGGGGFAATSLSIVYPTKEDRAASFEAAENNRGKIGSCLSYSVAENNRQPWLWEHLW